jgi:hypothetical protein
VVFLKCNVRCHVLRDPLAFRNIDIPSEQVKALIEELL